MGFAPYWYGMAWKEERGTLRTIHSFIHSISARAPDQVEGQMEVT